jgi:hypothetical protein
VLPREEYIEQAYLFRTWRERLDEATAAQELLLAIREEILATTRLPLAIDFLAGELHHHGRIGTGMGRLSHYFTPFQAFVMQQAEVDSSRFDFRLALEILQNEAEYRASDNVLVPALFIYQFECIARNRLGYDAGLVAVAGDQAYPKEWREWILKIRRDLGTIDFADMLYVRSEQWLDDYRRESGQPDYQPSFPILFDRRAGRIAKANIGREPLFMFAALQRQLGYPRVPRPKPARRTNVLDPAVELRFQRLEARLQMLEQEQKGELDLTPFLRKPDQSDEV